MKREDELDVEVTSEDQKMINSFSKLNQRYHELEAERKMMEEEIKNIQDANNDLLLSDFEGPVKYQLGEVYVEMVKDDVQALLEKEETRITNDIAGVDDKVVTIKKDMQVLKDKLYGKFTKAAINLDEE